MEEKTIKINNLEVSCEALIEFTSLTKVLLELVKRQKENEKKLNDHDIIIRKLISQGGGSGAGSGVEWPDKENEFSNIFKDEDNYNLNNLNDENNDSNDENNNDYNSNNNLSNEANIDTIKDNSNNITGEKDENADENSKNKESSKDIKEISKENKNINVYDKDSKKNYGKSNDDNNNDNNNDNKDSINTNKDNNRDNNRDSNRDNINTNTNKDNTNKDNTNKDTINNNDDSSKKQASKGRSKDNDLGSNFKINAIKPIKSLEQEMKLPSGDNSNNQELVSKLFQRIIILEKKVNELITKSGEHLTLLKNIKNNRENINDLKKNVKKLNDVTGKMNKDLEKIKGKLEDFNVFDMFKDSGDGNIDMAKGMVMALESKLTKRLGLMDEKYKKLSEDIFKNKNDLTNLSVKLDGSKMQIDKNTKKIDEILLNNENNKNNDNNELNGKVYDDITQKIEEIIKNININEDKNNNRFKEIEDKFKDEIKNNFDNLINMNLDKKNDKSLDDLTIIKTLKERIVEIEKTIKNMLKRFNIDEINSNLSVLQKEILKKGNQGEINDIQDRIYALDEFLKEVNFKADTFSSAEKKLVEDMSLLTKNVESFASQLHRLSLNSNKNQKEEKSVIDFTKFIDTNTFEENKKEVNRKFDKIRISFEDILRNIEEILNKLSHTPTDKDFSQYQGIVKGMLDELKINCNKKYCDKYETTKSIKYLETQIKHIEDQYTKKAEGQDNWLLAKKPLSNYLCASCEGVIRGELDKRCDYIPWNKYPNREEKYTRMGHGFSHMLQMVNDDIRKNVDNKEKSKDKNSEKDYNSDEDKKKSLEKSLLINTSVKLPRVIKRTKNLVTLDDTAFGATSPYDNIDKISINENYNTPQIIKISKLKKITAKKSFQESSINDDKIISKKGLNVKTFPSEIPSFDKKQGENE